MLTLDTVYQFMSGNKELIKDFKITSFKQVSFSDMDGYVYRLNIKLTTIDGYKNKLLKVVTNSTYLDEMGETIKDFQYNLTDWYYTALA
jgi:hypothetical protein